MNKTKQRKFFKLSADKGDAKRGLIEMICQVQIDVDKLNEASCDEILQLEQKFNKLRQPHYSSRSELIAKVPNFWLTVFANHPDVSAIISEADIDVLRHLTKVEVSDYEDIKTGYKISFKFKKNPYFRNRVIWKEFNIGSTNDLSLPTTKVSRIRWHPGKSLVRKSRAKRRFFEQDSFFCWFANGRDPTADEVGEAIRFDIWPNPVQYYRQSALSDWDFSDEEDDEEEECLGGKGKRSAKTEAD